MGETVSNYWANFAATSSPNGRDTPYTQTQWPKFNMASRSPLFMRFSTDGEEIPEDSETLKSFYSENCMFFKKFRVAFREMMEMDDPDLVKPIWFKPAKKLKGREIN
jgi:hypothetical protein